MRGGRMKNIPVPISMTETDSTKLKEVAKAMGISKSELWRLVWRQWLTLGRIDYSTKERLCQSSARSR